MWPQEINNESWSVFPLRPYVAKLAQHFEKLTQQILWEWVKKMLFLDNLANFQPKLMIVVQEPLQFCQIWENWSKLKNVRGNTGPDGTFVAIGSQDQSICMCGMHKQVN